MNIEEINNLVKTEQDGCLRFPIKAQDISEEEAEKGEQLLLRLKWFLDEEKEHGFVGCLFRRLLMKKQKGINSFAGLGTIKHPYKVKTDFGEGVFYDARKGFDKNRYPEWIKQNHCYSNCLQFALLTKVDCEILSGIAYMDKPFLHSVILFKDKVIDFNYNIVMSKDLYCAITKFECLAELSADRVRETVDLVMSKRDILTKSNLSCVTINFAFEDVLDYLQNEQRQINQPNLGVD